jgi:hypothetical protein
LETQRVPKPTWANQFVRPPSSKITKAQWIGGMAQTVQHLLRKGKALSSNPNPTPKTNKKKCLLFQLQSEVLKKIKTKKTIKQTIKPHKLQYIKFKS